VGARLEVARVAGIAMVQDAGRPGHMHEGVPPGGALVPDLFARANIAARNPRGTAALEVFGAMSLFARDGDLELGGDDGSRVIVREGERFDFSAMPELRVRYLAVRGGLDVPQVLGGRGTLLVAGLGGFEGRPLRAGDRIPVGTVTEAPFAPEGQPFLPEGAIRVQPGPDEERFDPAALDVLVTEPYALLPASNRAGTRLGGPPLVRRDADDGRSAPMVWGAIEVPSGGAPIVLGPDHPTTGGYPVLATVVRGDLGRFGARPIGSLVRFRRVTRAGDD